MAPVDNFILNVIFRKCSLISCNLLSNLSRDTSEGDIQADVTGKSVIRKNEALSGDLFNAILISQSGDCIWLI